MTQRLWIEYHNTKLDGRIAPACGTDAFQPLDGRYSVATARHEAVTHAARMIRVHADYVGFRIHRGTSPTNAYPVTLLERLA